MCCVTDETFKAPVYVTYWLNKLQHLNHSRNIFVSLNPTRPPAAHLTYQRLNYEHPQYTPEAVAAQREVAALLQGQDGTHYCGAWLGYGFHEDGFRSGIDAAVKITQKLPPWRRTFPAAVTSAHIPAASQSGAKRNGSSSPTSITAATSSAVLTSLPDRKKTTNGTTVSAKKPANTERNILSMVVLGPLRASILGTLCGHVSKVLVYGFETVCYSQVVSFLQKGFHKGRLTLLMPDNRTLVFQEKPVNPPPC